MESCLCAILFPGFTLGHAIFPCLTPSLIISLSLPQDLHSGTLTAPTNQSFGLYFSGHHILEVPQSTRSVRHTHGPVSDRTLKPYWEAILQDLLTTAHLRQSTMAVLSGASAGGIGAWINADWLQDILPHATVLGAPIAGFYAFAYPYEGPWHTTGRALGNFSEAAFPSHVHLWNSFLPQGCAKALGALSYRCLLSNYSAPYIKVPMFVTEAQTDAVQLMYHDAIPPWAALGRFDPTNAYLAAWKANQTLGMRATLKAEDGWFNPACFIHTGFSHKGPLIEGRSYVNVFDEWLQSLPEGKQPPRLMDDCGILCGNQCTPTA